MNCRKCEAEILTKDGYKYCLHCGEAIPTLNFKERKTDILEKKPVSNQSGRTSKAEEKKLNISIDLKTALIFLLGIIVFALAILYITNKKDSVNPPTPAPNNKPTLRIHGSNTIGADLAPELAKAFLESEGAKDAEIVPGANIKEKTVIGTVNGTKQIIEIAAYDSKSAFDDLSEGKCDIGMSSRKIKKEEIDRLKNLGNIEIPKSEFLLGYDGVAVIVNKKNGLPQLTIENVKKIFSGKIKYWEELSDKKSGEINVYVREKGSGTREFFADKIGLEDKEIINTNQIDDSNELTKKVSSDENGIGFGSFSYVEGNAKSLPISDDNSTFYLPDGLTIPTSSYPLSRKLFLYLPSNTQNDLAKKFIQFIIDNKNKRVTFIVKQSRFISTDVKSAKPSDFPECPNPPEEYATEIADAERQNLDVEFGNDETEPDNDSLQRINQWIKENKNLDGKILLMGFASKIGGEQYNLNKSRERVDKVADIFEKNGINIKYKQGFGTVCQITKNEAGDYQKRNRRVEVWVK